MKHAPPERAVVEQFIDEQIKSDCYAVGETLRMVTENQKVKSEKECQQLANKYAFYAEFPIRISEA